MIGECIYSQWYSGENISTWKSIPAMTMYRNSNRFMDDKEYIQNAIEISENKQISLNIYEREDRIRLDFLLRATVLDDGETLLWDDLADESDLFGLSVRSDSPQIIVASFARIKDKYAGKKKLTWEADFPVGIHRD